MPQAANHSVSKRRNDVLYRSITQHYDITGEFYFLRRGQPIDVMRYLPKFLAKDPEFLKIQNALSKEHEKLKAKAMDVVRQFYIETATWGLTSWERIFEVTPPPGADYELRRSMVKAQMAGWGVMTVEQTTWLMNQFVTGKDGSINELPEPGILEFVIPSGISNRMAMRKALNEMLPAHLVFRFLYAIYGDLVDDEAANIGEDRIWTVTLAKSAREHYPWRGRYFDTSWTFTPRVCFDGTWDFDGAYRFDGIPTGEEDDAGAPFRFDGDWFFDEGRRFGYPASRKILFGTQESDELTVVPKSAIKEQYAVTLPFDALTPFDTGWAFGARDGPQETTFSAAVSPVLQEAASIQEEQETITVLRPVLRDIYPLPHPRFFDGAWALHAPILMDGAWGFGGNERARFGDMKYEPWMNLPILFFEEQKETKISYEEISLSFDGMWDFERDSTRRFSDIVEIPRMEPVDGTPYDGRIFDNSWQFFGLHVADAFWNEDAQERFVLLQDEPEPEHLQTQEKAILSTRAGFTDSVFAKKVLNGTWEFSEVQAFGSGSIAFEGLPAFSEGRSFDRSWSFGLCGRLFDGTWSLGEDSAHFNDTWHFGGEEYFPEDGRKEASEIGLHSILSDRLKHFRRFGEGLTFDGEWSLGGITGPQETETPWQIATSMEEEEPMRDEARISVSVAFREHAPISPVPSFNGEWAFPETYMFDGAWQFGSGTVFGEAARETSLPNGEKIFREKSVEEQLFVGEQPTATISDTMTRTNAFGEGLAFDGEWSFGEQEGCSESMAVFVSVGLRFDGTWDFDGEARVLDGTWSLGTDSYSFGENAEPRNRFDGTWNFTDSGTRIRFERRWNSFGIETIAA